MILIKMPDICKIGTLLNIFLQKIICIFLEVQYLSHKTKIISQETEKFHVTTDSLIMTRGSTDIPTYLTSKRENIFIRMIHEIQSRYEIILKENMENEFNF